MLEALGKYKIIEQIGKGSMGIVYKARDPHIDRIVALKTLLLPYSSATHDIEMVSRLRQEAQAAGKLMHPNIVVIYEYGEDGDTAYIAMAYVEGRELKSYLENEESFSLAAIYNIMRQILSALQYSHLNDITHRDIKPSNIMIMPDGHVMVTDFGIARLESSELTQVGTAIGTPSYMSPEQCMGQKVDGRSDIFSAGIILYQLLTGVKPFDGPSVASILHKIVQGDPVPPSVHNSNVPEEVDAILKKCLAKAPEDRFATAEEFSIALQQVLEDGVGLEAQSGDGAFQPAGIAQVSAWKRRDVAAQSGDELTAAHTSSESASENAVGMNFEDKTILLAEAEVVAEGDGAMQQDSPTHSQRQGIGVTPNDTDKPRFLQRKVLLFIVVVLFALVVPVGLKMINPDSALQQEGGSQGEIGDNGVIEHHDASSIINPDLGKQQTASGGTQVVDKLDHVPLVAVDSEKPDEGVQEPVKAKLSVHEVQQGAEVDAELESDASVVGVGKAPSAEEEEPLEVGNVDEAEQSAGNQGVKEAEPAHPVATNGSPAGPIEMEVDTREAIELHSVPGGVAVEIEALDIHEVTPTVLHPGPGQHQLYLSKSGFHDMSIVVLVNREEQVALTVPMVPQ